MSAARFCPACGDAVAGGGRFCRSCGGRLPEVVAVTGAEAAAALAAAIPAAPPAVAAPPAARTRRRSPRGATAAGAALAVLVLAGGVVAAAHLPQRRAAMTGAVTASSSEGAARAFASFDDALNQSDSDEASIPVEVSLTDAQLSSYANLRWDGRAGTGLDAVRVHALPGNRLEASGTYRGFPVYLAGTLTAPGGHLALQVTEASVGALPMPPQLLSRIQPALAGALRAGGSRLMSWDVSTTAGTLRLSATAEPS